MKPLNILLKSLRSFELTGNPDTNVTEILFDSRAVSAQPEGSTQLYVAQRGTQTDGHKYMLQCYEKGCRVFLCKRIPEEMAGKDFAAVLTEDPVSSLGKIASEYRKTFDLKVVGVTGSVGKTTTKVFEK